MRPYPHVLLALLALVASGCGEVVVRDGPGERPRTLPPDAVPREEPLSKYGNPESYVVLGKRYYTLKSSKGFRQRGVASWYGSKFQGRRTSSGEIYDMYKMTAAHKQLPLPSYVQVRNLDNGRVATVRVNDRGPFHENRIIDLSYAAALKLGMADKGTAFVEIAALDASGKPIGPAAPVPRPAPEPASEPEHGMYIQVGAFLDIDNARRLAEQIERVAPGRVHIRDISSRGRTLHRVQVGPVASVEFADGVVAALERIGIIDHHFVSN